MQAITDEVDNIDELMQLIAEQQKDDLNSEFENLDDPVRSFRFEYAMESITESNSRFKRRNSF